MNYYEEHPYWVRKDDPTVIVCVREYDTTTLMWEPKRNWKVTAQRLDTPTLTLETYDEPDFRKLFEEFTPPTARVVGTGSSAWWRKKLYGREFVQVVEVIRWQGPRHPVRVRFSAPQGAGSVRGETFTLTEDEFLKYFEPSGPPPDKKTVWGKVWEDDF